MMNTCMLINKNDEEYDFFREARYYRRLGLSVIPLWIDPPEYLRAKEEQTGKLPAVKWSEFQERTATDLELSTWFNIEDHNIGIVTGDLSGVVVLDIDSEEAYKLALTKGLPDTPTVKTGRGYHLYFKYKEGIRNFQKRGDLPGIDLRGEGGYVVAPPSIHYGGSRYQWVRGKEIEELEFAELPEWVLAKTPEERKPVVDLLPGVSAGERNDALTRIVGSLVKNSTHDEVVRIALEWNQRCNPPDDEQQVLRTVKSIWEREYAGLPEDIGPADWEDPILFEAEPLPHLSADVAPSYLGEYAGAISRAIQAPEGMAVMLGLSAIATAVQKKIVVSPYRDGDYIEPANIWTVVVADPSERKSPVLREMMDPLVKWETERRVRLQEERVRAETERDVIESRLKKLKSDAANAETAEARERIATQINELKASIPEEVRFPVLWTGNVTTERLEQLMVDNEEKMSVMTDEGGIFEVMAGLYTNGRVSLDIFMQGYSGNPTRADRASRSAHMENPLLTLGLAIQPKVLQDLSRGSKRVFRGNGLLARFLYYQCESQRGRRLFANQQSVSPEVRTRYAAGLRRLLDISLEYDDSGKIAPRKLYLDDEARTLWVGFHDEVESKMAPSGEFESISDWAGKLAGNTLRVAALFHAIEHGVSTRGINRDTTERAINLMRALIPHAKSALNTTCTSDLARDAEGVYEWILRKNCSEFTKRECHRDMQSRFRTVKDLDPVLSELVSRNVIRLKVFSKSNGRPSSIYDVNPALWIYE